MLRSRIVFAVAVSSLVAVSLGCRRPPHDRFEHGPLGSTEAGTFGPPFMDAELGPRGTVAGALPLEGELDVELRGAAVPVQYAVVGDQVYLRTRPPSGSGAARGRIDIAIDTSRQKATVVLHDRKRFFDVELADMGGRLKERVASASLEHKGDTGTVAGHSCEEWAIRDRDYRISACVAKRDPYIDVSAVERHIGSTAPAWAHRIADAGLVPLRVSIEDAKGAVLFSSRLSPTPRRVESWRLQIPAGYEKAGVSMLFGSTLQL